jgi:hypothetical protein
MQFKQVWMLFLLLPALAGCSIILPPGVRQVARPGTTQGYQRTELRDVAGLDLTDLNVEVEGVLVGRTASNSCGGMLTYALLSGSMSASPSGGARPHLEQTKVFVTLPRARYAEAHDLQRWTECA